MRAFVELWDEITRERYGVEDPKMRRFRYGVQVNSLGLTEAQPENNVQRIVLEMLGVTLSKNARARAVQLPAWNEALGLPRPVGPAVVAAAAAGAGLRVRPAGVRRHLRRLARRRGQGRRARRRRQGRDRPGPGDGRGDRGGRVRLHEAGAGLLATPPVAPGSSPARRRSSGSTVYETTEPSPLTADLDAAIMAADPEAEKTALASVEAWKAQRDEAEVAEALAKLAEDAKTDANLMTATLAAARAGATTGEWAGTLREVFGEFRAPTGVSGAVGVAEAGRRAHRRPRARSARPARSCGQAAGSGCWSASPGSTATPTAPSRSPYAPATPASR